MPPKRKKTQQTQPPASAPSQQQRKRPAAAAPSSPQPQLNIDYDQLADAILKKQRTIQSSVSAESSNNAISAQPVSSSSTNRITTTASRPQETNSCQTPVSASIINQTTQMTTEASSSSAADPADSFNIPMVLNTLFGGESATSNAPQPLNFSNNIPLGATVSNRLKQKIYENTYFDLRLLLPNHQDDNFSVSVERGAINFQQGKFQKFPITINQWTSAFLIFSSIYIQKTPSDAAHLFKYIYMIRDMSFTTKNDSWRYYDEEFRKLRQSSPLPWQEPLSELVLRANLQPSKFRPSNQPFLVKNKTSSYSNTRIKFCYSFNQGQPCRADPCTYKHACQYCKEQHPRFKCPKLPPNDEKQPSKSSNSSKARNS